jgi:hypothetical protein
MSYPYPHFKTGCHEMRKAQQRCSRGLGVQQQQQKQQHMAIAPTPQGFNSGCCRRGVQQNGKAVQKMT